MTAPKPRSAAWMEFRPPEEDESFEEYWAAAGASQAVIRNALKVSHEGAEELANDRMISWARTKWPQVFDDYVEDMLIASGGRLHPQDLLENIRYPYT